MDIHIRSYNISQTGQVVLNLGRAGAKLVTVHDVREASRTVGKLSAANGCIIAGDEPFDQAGALAVMVSLLKSAHHCPSIQVNTQTALADLLNPQRSYWLFMPQIFLHIDHLKDAGGQILDVQASILANKPVMLPEPVHA